MTAPRLLCWIVVNATPYHVARFRAAAKQVGWELCLVQLTEMDDFPILQAQQGAADGFGLRTLCPRTPASQIVGRRLKSHLIECLNELRPSIVCINGWSFGGGISTLSWCLSHRVPVIMMSESTASDERRYWWKEAIKRRVVRLCSASLVGGLPHQDYAIELGAPPDSVFSGYDVVDNRHFQSGAIAARRNDMELRKELGLPLRYFMACSRFSRKKNLFGLLQAYARYRERCRDEPWSMVLIGGGELKDELIAHCGTLGLPRVCSVSGTQELSGAPKLLWSGERFCSCEHRRAVGTRS